MLRVCVLLGLLFYPTLLLAQFPDLPPGRVSSGYEIPVLDGPQWLLTGNPELGDYTSDKQQPVDFGVWQAADGTWQLWSCIRNTKCGGNTRLFYCWEGPAIDQSDWQPKGIAMEADEQYGETKGGLQAPYVVQHEGKYHMLYGDWHNICLATSKDGKKFERYVQPNGKTGLFREDIISDKNGARDPMTIKIGKLWYVYTTSHPNNQCVIRCRTSSDLKKWSDLSATVSFGGIGGAGPYSAECPHVVKHGDNYYLFRTETYSPEPRTHVYVSSDPLHFGINRDDWYYVTTLPVAAPEYVQHEGQEYLVSLKPTLDGIRAHRLTWLPMKSAEPMTPTKK